MIKLVVENDPAMRLIPVVLDPASPPEALTAYADFLGHDVPDVAAWLHNLRQKIPSIYPATCVKVDEPEELRRELADADGLIVESLRVGQAELSAGPRLRFVQKFGGQTPNIDLAACAARGMPVSVQRRRVNVAVAEQAFMFIIALAKRVTEISGLVDDAALRKAGYNPDPYDRRYTVNSNFSRIPGLRTLNESTLGLLGTGEIGREVALRAKAFGMQILYYQRTRLSAGEEAFLGLRYADLPELLANADFVSIHLPHTAQTHGLINRETISLMKPGAILVNSARAEIVDHDALVQALESKRLGGFALDTGYREPAAPDEPLKRFPNAILMPHTGPADRQNVLKDMEEMCLKMNGIMQAGHRIGSEAGAPRLAALSGKVRRPF